MKDKYIDKSEDKKYFTIIPNYITNHSSANDQALYLQMKRLVGDSEGVCYASEKYFKDKLGVGSKALKKSIIYLLKCKWIENAGVREYETKGGVQKIKTYLVKDIWKMNMKYYSKGVSEREHLVKSKGVSESNARGVQKEAKGVAFKQQRRTIKKNIEEEGSNASVAVRKDQVIFDLIELFKPINPSYEKFFRNTTQRGALERLVKKFGPGKVEEIISILPITNTKKYAPTITTPLQLEDKLGQLVAFTKQQKSESILGTTL